MFLLLALLGTVVASPLIDVERDLTNDQLAERYYLPREVIPTFYDVTLFLDPDVEASFDGEVSIRVTPEDASTNRITLHAMEMIIHSVTVRDVNDLATNLYSNHDLATDDTHKLTITTTTALQVDHVYTIFIEYTGHYAENMFGIYLSTYDAPDGTPKKLITSQLQPTFARRAFPCFDEPALKAVFRTTIYAPPAYPVVRSNMPERPADDQLKRDVDRWVKFEFQDTLVMSTYLIAYLVSDFTNISNEDDPIYRVPFRIYSRPGTEETAEFALEFGQQNMLALEEYTEFDYDFPKLDKAAVPDFAAGAMENWGLVIYREVALLVRDGVTTTAVRQNIGRIICHENMHMWFGNEVGPWSWTFTWLNEGFANFFENFATDFVRPEWRMMDQYVVNMQNVFQNDAVATVNPMTHPVFSPSQILSTFNAVAYQKSGSVIRMLQHIMTPEIFRQGLVLYIKNMTRDAAQPEDLYRNLQQALDASPQAANVNRPIATIMDRWTNQGGFPVVTVTRDAPSANSITIAQERFLTDRGQSSNHRWHIPVNWALSTDPDFSNTSPQSWVPESFPAHSVDIPGFAQATWYIINKQQTGYYRVNYDEQNWAALGQVLNDNHEIIHLLNRAQLVDDSFNLARNGRVDYNYAMEISRYLVKEVDYIPWAAANAAFGYLEVVLESSEVFDLWQRYILELTAPLYASLGFETIPGEEFVTPYHRNIILNFNCRYGNAGCVSRAEELLANFRNNDERPHPDIQTSVYCSGLRGGDGDNFEFLWQEYLASTDSSEQSIFLNALGCTSNPTTRTFYLNQVTATDSLVREQDRHTIVVATLNASPENMDVALDFVVENFHLIQPRVQGLSGTTNILNGFARRLTTQAHSEKIDEFVSRHGSIFTAGEQAAVSAIRDNIASSISWTDNHLARVQSWLRLYYGEEEQEPEPTPEPEEPEPTPEPEEPEEPEDDGATAISASVVIFISAIVTLFNH